MKKFLSMLLALAMVLTMAAFPAFAAESVKLQPVGVTSNQAPEDSSNTLVKIFDGNYGTGWGNYYKVGTKLTTAEKGSGPLVIDIDLGVPFNITQFNIAGLSCHFTGFALYGSNDLTGEWTEIADLSVPDRAKAELAVTHEGYYRYIRFEGYKLNYAGNPGVEEMELFGVLEPSLTKIEGLNASNVSYEGASLRQSSKQNMDTLFDGDFKRTPSSAAAINGIQFNWTPSATVKKIEVTLNEVANIAALKLFWGNSDTNAKPAQTYNIYFAGEDGVYGSAAHTYTDNATTYNGVSRDDGVILDNVAVGVKKIMIEITAHYATGDPALREIEIYKSNAVMELIPATYTVKYKSDDPNFVAPADKVVEGKYVGNKVTETAPVITGYTVDEATKSITLVDGTNEIVFTYTARPAATYTVEYVDADGNPIADAKEVTTGFYADDKVTETAVTVAGYKPTETSKEVTLAAGANTIKFIYSAAESVTYTVNYVDAAGNPIADAKTVTAYEGDVVTEIPAVVTGYFCTDTVRSVVHTLVVDGDNTITFTYNKVLTPTTVTRNQAPGTSNSGPDLTRLYDGTFNATTQYTIPASYDFSTRPVEYVYAFSAITNFDKISVYTSYNRYTKAKIYTSLDGEEWTLALSSETIRDDQQVLSGFVTEANATTTVYLNEFVLPEGTQGTQLKLEIVETNVSDSQTTWCGIYEMAVEGAAKESAYVDVDGVKPNSNWGWKTGSMTKTDASVLFDGNPASDKEGYFAQGYFGANSQPKAGVYDLEIDLGAVYDNPSLTIQGGTPNWDYSHLIAYDVYVAGIDGVYGKTPAAVIDYSNGKTLTSEALTDAIKIRTDMIAVTGEVRYVKLVVNYALRRPVIGEISVYAAPVDLAANPEKAGASLGGQIRLPDESLTAGLRFGATIMKGVVNANGEDYDFDALATAGAEIGMFMLPADMLDGQTLAQYLANGGQNALKVPAKRILSENDASVTFTAVLVDIPESAYDRYIVAVPYLYIDGEYIFYSEMTKNYKGVAAAVADSYQKGELELTDPQIELLEKITGETLVVPAE